MDADVESPRLGLYVITAITDTRLTSQMVNVAHYADRQVYVKALEDITRQPSIATLTLITLLSDKLSISRRAAKPGRSPLGL